MTATAPPMTALASPWRKKSERLQDREIKRVAVLRAAAQVFNERGFQAATLDEVAARLNVSKPTLYYYVKSKDDILFQCVHTALSMMKQAVDDVRAAGGHAMDRLNAAMREYIHIVTQDFGMCVIRVGEDPLPPESRAELRRMKAAIDREFRDLVREGIHEGLVAPCDPKIAAFMIAGALSWVGRWYRPDGELSSTEIADQLIELVQRSLCGGHRASPPNSLKHP